MECTKKNTSICIYFRNINDVAGWGGVGNIQLGYITHLVGVCVVVKTAGAEIKNREIKIVKFFITSTDYVNYLRYSNKLLIYFVNPIDIQYKTNIYILEDGS